MHKTLQKGRTYKHFFKHYLNSFKTTKNQILNLYSTFKILNYVWKKWTSLTHFVKCFIWMMNLLQNIYKRYNYIQLVKVSKGLCSKDTFLLSEFVLMSGLCSFYIFKTKLYIIYKLSFLYVVCLITYFYKWKSDLVKAFYQIYSYLNNFLDY